MSAPRPYVTDPFHPPSSVRNVDYSQFPYIFKTVRVLSTIWYIKVRLETTHMRSYSTLRVDQRSLCCPYMAHTDVYEYEIHVNLLNWGNYRLSRAVQKSDLKTNTILVTKLTAVPFENKG